MLLSHLDVAGGEASVHFTVGGSGEEPEDSPVSEVVLEDSVVRDSEYTAADCTPGPCERMTFRRLKMHGQGRQLALGAAGRLLPCDIELPIRIDKISQ